MAYAVDDLIAADYGRSFGHSGVQARISLCPARDGTTGSARRDFSILPKYDEVVGAIVHCYYANDAGTSTRAATSGPQKTGTMFYPSSLIVR